MTTNALEGITWGTFERLFLGKYFLDHARNAKRVEFLSLRQGDISVANFEAHLGDLERFKPDITSNDATKGRMFERALRLGLCGKVMGFELPTYNQVVQKAMMFEKEYNSAKKIREARPSSKGIQIGSSSGSQHKKLRHKAP